MEKRRQPEIIAGRVNADGTIAAGEGFTVQHPSGGVYDVTITAPGFRYVSASASPATGNGQASVIPPVVAGTTWRSGVLGPTGAAADLGLSFVAIGVQV